MKGGAPSGGSSAATSLPRIKVCGVRALGDVRGALALGLDAVGLVEHPRSPRALAASAAAALVAELPPELVTVGVFVDRAPGYVAAWLAETGARVAQLCGAERADEWRGFAYPLLRRVAVDATGAAEIERWRSVAAGFVLDHPDAPGGTGRPVDLARAAELAALAPCLLAGGLGPSDVAEKVERVRPAGVDASSRLETAPGVKDPARVTAFVRAAAAALAGARA